MGLMEHGETVRLYVDVSNSEQSIYLTPVDGGLLVEIDGPSLTLPADAVANLRKALQRYEYSQRPAANPQGYVTG